MRADRSQLRDDTYAEFAARFGCTPEQLSRRVKFTRLALLAIVVGVVVCALAPAHVALSVVWFMCGLGVAYYWRAVAAVRLWRDD